MTNKIDKIQMPDGQVLELNGGGGLEVGDISTALYVNEAKNLRRYLNGQIVDNNKNTKVFIEDYLLGLYATNPDYFATEDNWQSEALLNIDGCVYKFVLNYSGETVVSVRLPKYPDYVEINAGGTLPVVGNGMALGLTNGTNNVGLSALTNNYTLSMVDSAYGIPVKNVGVVGQVQQGVAGVTTDPTKSGIQTTLKQTKLKMRYFIQIATGSETEANIVNTLENVNGFTLLESKYSDKPLYNESWLLSNGQYNAKAVYPTVYEALQVEYNTEIEAGTTVTLPSGVSYTKRGLSVKLSTETYTDYDFVLNTADETFRLPLLDGSEDLFSSRIETLEIQSNPQSFIAPANGWFQALATTTTANGYVYFGGGYSTASLNKITYTNPTNYKVYDTVFVNKGESVTIGAGGATLDSVRFYYAQGNGSLYFYVGDIDQNHGIVNMGRIGEQLATKTDMLQASGAGMPSNKYIDLTLGASGSTYTAPANGWFYANAHCNSTGHQNELTNTTKGMSTISPPTTSSFSFNCKIYIPVQKNDIVKYSYTQHLVDAYSNFRFIYAEGSK